ncbi:hypothetical protein AAV94_09645 [Lampropedia cohaerens]|uniref:Uncharacterized protein n=1 Tax=Lampropedia cohaerens TaxID=1610491 RepID=A0A0U1PZ18_9BURK|nr:hypothetical protein AAV94_09645 [Lampropedia cohaerens]
MLMRGGLGFMPVWKKGVMIFMIQLTALIMEKIWVFVIERMMKDEADCFCCFIIDGLWRRF